MKDAFWLLVATIEHYLNGYYLPNMERLRVHATMFDYLLKKRFSKLHKHLASHDVYPLIYVTNWFLTLYTMMLPWPSVLRVWDMFYCDGKSWLSIYTQQLM